MDSIFTLLSGLKGQQRQMDATANNIANANTPGYKKDTVLFREIYSEFATQDLESEQESFAHDEFINPLSRGGSSFVMPDHVSPQMSSGRMIPTNSPKDLALQGEGFFVVETPYGTRYTRSGQFMEDAQGYLITPEGDRVQGEKGPILVKNREFSVGQEGTIMIDRQRVDKLKIMKFEQPDRLTKLGKGYWVPGSDRQVPIAMKNPQVHQGVYERSNVEIVEEMVDMIAINRSYEASQKAMKAYDDLDSQAISLARI